MSEARQARARRSVAFGFVFIVIATFAAGQGVAWVWFLFTQKGHNQRVVNEKVVAIANMLAEASSHAIAEGDFKLLRQYSESIIVDKDIVSISVKDSSGNIVMREAYDTGVLGKTKSLNPLYVPWSNRMTLPVMYGDERVGAVELVYSGEGINKVMFDLITIPPIVEAIMFLILVYIIYFFFQKHVGIPIGAIKTQLDKVTSGDLTAKMPVVEKNEIGVISDGLDFLVTWLSLTIRRLNATSENIAIAIRGLRLTFDKGIETAKRQSSSTEGMTFSLKNSNSDTGKIQDAAELLSRFSTENISALFEVKATGETIVQRMDMLFRAAENSYATVLDMSRISGEMSESVQKVLESVENTSASVEEIVASVREVERSAKDSSQIAEEVKQEAAQNGVASVSEAVQEMEKIVEKVRFSVELVRRLHARSNEVEKVLSVIKEVTEQTNLLSLNAAILAEEAGEFGKGFSVVADEMRALSNRTSTYTKEIGTIIKEIHEEIREIATAIEDGMQRVKIGRETVYRLGETMSEILEKAHKSASMTRGIERATEEQANSLSYISEAIVNISNKANRMSRDMNEQLDGYSFLLERSGELKEIAEVARKNTEEQASATSQISRNLEATNDRVEEITERIQSQQRVNSGIMEAMEEIRSGSINTVRDMEGVSALLNKLQKEIDLLSKETAKFKVE